MRRRTALVMLASVLVAPYALGAAQTFDMAAFERAKKEGKPILVMVHAQWCPTCRKQEPAVEALLKTPEFAGVSWFKVDFDSQDAVLQAFKVSKQSTLIMFRGDKEIARSTGQTAPDAIAGLIRKAL